LSDADVTFADYKDLDAQSKITFQEIGSRAGRVCTAPIVVTELMRKIYNCIITCSKGTKVLIVGPPGTGKSTTLFWLYMQFKSKTKYEVVAVPINGTSIVPTPQHDKQLILMSDILSPSTVDRKGIENLITTRHNHLECIMVIAESSMFRVYSKLSPATFSLFTKGFIDAEKFLSRPFTDTEAATYLEGLGVDASVTSVSGTKVPKLLSHTCRDNYREVINEEIETECLCLCEAMCNKGFYINWGAELAVVVAARLGKSVTDFGLNVAEAKLLYVCISYLIHFIEDKPVCLFPLDESVTRTIVQRMWASHCKYVKTSSNAVIGVHFEANITSCILPHLSVTIMRLHPGVGVGERKDVKFSFAHVSQTASTTAEVKRSEQDLLLHLISNFPAIDYAAYVTFEEELCLLAIQVSIQQSNAKDKIAKTVNIPTELTNGVRVILIYINPFFTNFEDNIGMAREVTSCARSTSRFTNWDYGQPSDYSSIYALKAYLYGLFSTSI
jgi:energy-coupling factor transporter ATP-binding protein EcfA2